MIQQIDDWLVNLVICPFFIYNMNAQSHYVTLNFTLFMLFSKKTKKRRTLIEQGSSGVITSCRPSLMDP